ncbi:MAG: hypothetical protein H3C35_01815 [Bacteroidetes bacterium]|nr:hypothetical protein [Bacteroidota bacterium]
MDDNKEQTIIENPRSIEDALQILWEKAREASVVISTLREEKKKLQYQVEELTQELQQTHNDLLVKRTELEKLRTENTGTINGSAVVAEEEKKELQQKLQLILEKINSYL